MTTFTFDDVKRDPAAFLAAVERGERVELAVPGRVVAQVVPSPRLLFAPGELRPIGLAKGQFVVPDDFDDPLPDEWLDAFYNSPIEPQDTDASVDHE